jgi:hypothetical protein
MERMDRREKMEFLQLSREWDRLSETLMGMIERLSQLENLSPNQLFQLNQYRQFQDELRVVSAGYARYSADVIAGEQYHFGRMALEASNQMLSLSAKFYVKLPIESIQKMVGITSEGTPLFDVLTQRYGDNAQKSISTLIDSMALGRNPILTAQLMGADLNGNLWKSIQIARTEQLFVLREVQTDSYIQSGICIGKDWVGEPDACPEICLPGIEKNPYPLDATMDSHPNCRCGWSPVI